MVKQAKLLSVLMAALLVLSVVPAFASANTQVPLEIEYLRIDGEQYSPYDTTNKILDVKRGDVIPIRLRVHALADVEDVQITAGLYGFKYSNYEADKVFQTTRTFDLKQDHTTTRDLVLEVPVKMDADYIKLRIFVADKNSLSYTAEYNLNVVGVADEEAILIKSAYLSPSNTVMASRALSALVKIENVGTRTLDDVTLVVSVPELGIRDVETLDRIYADDVETFEKVILRFPQNTPAGQYMVDYTVKFDEYESVTKTDVVTVTACEAAVCAAPSTTDEPSGETLISVPEAKVIKVGGEGAAFPVSITNTASTAKVYTLSVSGVSSWGTARVDPSAVVLVPAESSRTAFVYVSANADAEVSSKSFTVTVSTEEQVKDITLTVALEAGEEKASTSWNGLTRTLEIGLIILVIVLILIGLIIGFNKLRGNDENEDEDAKTYY